MSYSEVYTFDKEGNAHFYGEVKNANAGVRVVWETLEKKYLPSIEDPYWKVITHGEYVSRVLISMCDPESKLINEIWDLANDERLTDEERIVLCCTFDKCIVEKEKLWNVIMAFEHFEGKSNLYEVAQVLRRVLLEPGIMGVGFSVSLADGWLDRGLVNELGEKLPYNIFKQDYHWFLFEKLGANDN